jgi:hypothetical protein
LRDLPGHSVLVVAQYDILRHNKDIYVARFLLSRHFKRRTSAILSFYKGETLRMGAIPRPRGLRMRYIASAKFSFRFVTPCRTRIH